MLEYSMAGLLVGFLVKLTGMGGGALLTPILTLVLGVPPTWAVGTDIVHSVVIKSASLRGYWKRKQINFQVVRWLAYGSVPATFLTALVIGQSSKHGSSHDGTIKLLIGIMLLIAAVLFPLKSHIAQHLDSWQARKGQLAASSNVGRKRMAATVAVGAVFGSVVAVTSVGSGTLIIISLALLYPMMENKTLIGTDIAQALILLLAGSAGYLTTGVGIDWTMLLWLLVGSLPGVYLGSRLSDRLRSPKWLTWLLTVILAASGVALLAG